MQDISVYQSGYPSHLYQENGADQCLANYTLLNENHIDDEASKGITCSMKNSTANGTWTYNNTVITCNQSEGDIHCVRPEPGSITLYTTFHQQPWSEGIHTCCIEGLCISVRIYQVDNFINLFPTGLSL